MSRRNRAEVRPVAKDPVYGSTVVTKVIYIKHYFIYNDRS